MRIEVWCWPFERERLRWCDDSGHVAIWIDSLVFDFHPAARGAASTRSPATPGLVLIRPATQVANEMGNQFDVATQLLDGTVSLDRTTWLFEADEGGVLPKLYAYPVSTDETGVSRLRDLLIELAGKESRYHLRENNCTHFVRNALAEAQVCTLEGDGWTPGGDDAGAYRPDAFNDLLRAQLGEPRRLFLAWQVRPRTKAGTGSSYVWCESPQDSTA